MAIQRVATAKRNAESKRQEDATKTALLKAGLTYVERKEVQKRAKAAPSYDKDKGIQNHNVRDLLGLGEFAERERVAERDVAHLAGGEFGEGDRLGFDGAAVAGGGGALGGHERMFARGWPWGQLSP